MGSTIFCIVLISDLWMAFTRWRHYFWQSEAIGLRAHSVDNIATSFLTKQIWRPVLVLNLFFSQYAFNFTPRANTQLSSVSCVYSNTPFTRWSWLDELALRALVEPASWMFAILDHSNGQIASSSSQLYERSSCARRALVEPASSCKRGIS